jgi:hypothetical protein
VLRQELIITAINLAMPKSHKSKVSTFLLFSFSIDVATRLRSFPGAAMALALLSLDSHDDDDWLYHRLAIEFYPKNLAQSSCSVGGIRPFHLSLVCLIRAFTVWNKIEPTKEWLVSQVRKCWCHDRDYSSSFLIVSLMMISFL